LSTTTFPVSVLPGLNMSAWSLSCLLLKSDGYGTFIVDKTVFVYWIVAGSVQQVWTGTILETNTDGTRAIAKFVTSGPLSVSVPTSGSSEQVTIVVEGADSTPDVPVEIYED
jgi:hypothetical protein